MYPINPTLHFHLLLIDFFTIPLNYIFYFLLIDFCTTPPKLVIDNLVCLFIFMDEIFKLHRSMVYSHLVSLSINYLVIEFRFFTHIITFSLSIGLC
jgi:hypothetical protein